MLLLWGMMGALFSSQQALRTSEETLLTCWNATTIETLYKGGI